MMYNIVIENGKFGGGNMQNYWLNEYLKISRGDGYHFEDFIYRLYKEYYEIDIELNGKSNDKGVDLIIDSRIGVQAKYYSTSLGIKAIQEIHAGISYYGLEEGMVITNATYNPNAIDFAKKLGVKLVDGNDILVIINRLSMGKKSPEIEKEKKLRLEQEKAKLSDQEQNSINDNCDESKTYIEFISQKPYKKLEKKEKVESKINHFNKYERNKHISTIEELYNIAKNDDDLFKQIFHQFTFLFSVREIDIYEKKTSLKIVDEEGNLNPRLNDAAYLYPIVGNNYEEYLQILKQDISKEQKLSKIKRKQIYETIILVVILSIVLLTILYAVTYKP